MNSKINLPFTKQQHSIPSSNLSHLPSEIPNKVVRSITESSKLNTLQSQPGKTNTIHTSHCQSCKKVHFSENHDISKTQFIQ